jgi:hypothetical protein
MISMQTVIETPAFLSDSKAAGLSEQERLAIVQTIATDPETGDVIPGTGEHAKSGLLAVAGARVEDFA